MSETPLRLHSVTIKNMMRITDVEVTFDQDNHLIIVGGRNEQGKSSFVDGVATAFTPGKPSDMPIHEGAKRAEETIILCNEDGSVAYTVEKIIRPSRVDVTVKDADGHTLPDARAWLDDMTARGYGFDPVAFCNAGNSAQGRRQQFETLKQLLGLDFTKHDTERKQLFDQRSAVNAEVKRLEAQLAGLTLHPDTPDAELSLAELTAQYEQATRQQSDLVSMRAKYQVAANALAAKRAKIGELQEELRRIAAQIETLGKEVETDEQALIELKAEGQRLNAQAIDPEPIKAQMAGIEATNRRVRENQQRKALKQELTDARTSAEQLTATLAAMDQQKREQIASAPMPIHDLSINDEEQTVLYQGRPLSVASTAGKLRVAVAMGISLLKRLKVLLIREGSALDDTNLRLIGEMAHAAGVQVIVERVGVAGASFVIENGTLADEETKWSLLAEERGVWVAPDEDNTLPVIVGEEHTTIEVGMEPGF